MPLTRTLVSDHFSNRIDNLLSLEPFNLSEGEFNYLSSSVLVRIGEKFELFELALIHCRDIHLNLKPPFHCQS